MELKREHIFRFANLNMAGYTLMVIIVYTGCHTAFLCRLVKAGPVICVILINELPSDCSVSLIAPVRPGLFFEVTSAISHQPKRKSVMLVKHDPYGGWGPLNLKTIMCFQYLFQTLHVMKSHSSCPSNLESCALDLGIGWPPF